jgi:hypothetical protein
MGLYCCFWPQKGERVGEIFFNAALGINLHGRASDTAISTKIIGPCATPTREWAIEETVDRLKSLTELDRC